MVDYRVYCMDRAGKIASAHWIKATDDAEAMQVASVEHAGKNCEVWLGPRRVGEVKATSPC